LVPFIPPPPAGPRESLRGEQNAAASVYETSRPYKRWAEFARTTATSCCPVSSCAFRRKARGLSASSTRRAMVGCGLRRCTLGPVGPLGLGEAREQAKRLRGAVAQGGDPHGDRMSARRQNVTAATVDGLVEATGGRKRRETVMHGSVRAPG